MSLKAPTIKLLIFSNDLEKDSSLCSPEILSIEVNNPVNERMHPDINDDGVDDKRVCKSFSRDHRIKLNCEESKTKLDVTNQGCVKQIESHCDKQNWA